MQQRFMCVYAIKITLNSLFHNLCVAQNVSHVDLSHFQCIHEYSLISRDLILEFCKTCQAGCDFFGNLSWWIFWVPKLIEYSFQNEIAAMQFLRHHTWLRFRLQLGRFLSTDCGKFRKSWRLSDQVTKKTSNSKKEHVDLY